MVGKSLIIAGSLDCVKRKVCCICSMACGREEPDILAAWPVVEKRAWWRSADIIHGVNFWGWAQQIIELMT